MRLTSHALQIVDDEETEVYGNMTFREPIPIKASWHCCKCNKRPAEKARGERNCAKQSSGRGCTESYRTRR